MKYYLNDILIVKCRHLAKQYHRPRNGWTLFRTFIKKDYLIKKNKINKKHLISLIM